MKDELSITLGIVEDADATFQVGIPDDSNAFDNTAANWVIRKIVEARAYAKRCAEWCDCEQARARRDEESLLFRFGPQLTAHTRKRITEDGGRRKSVNPPAGTIGFRSAPSKLVVDDEPAVIAWAKQHNPGIVSIVEKLSKEALNEHLEATGEMPDAGAHIEPACERFYIK